MLEENIENLSCEAKILQAAEKEFVEKGYAGAKTIAIAKRAGVTHAMLHYYFRTKENLFNQVFDEKVKVMVGSIMQSFDQPGASLLDRIISGMSAHFDFLVANPDLPRFVVNELISVPERQKIIFGKIKSLVHGVLVMFQNEIDDHVKRGVFHPIKAIDLILDIASVNVSIFVTLPLIKTIAISDGSNIEDFFKSRKQENIEIIRRRLLVNND